MTVLRSSSGFSMMEVLSSMTIFAVAVAGLAGTTMSTIRTNSVSRSTVAASALVHDKIEELRSMDPNAAPADFAAGTHYDGDNPIDALGNAGGTYTRSWIVNRDTPTDGTAEVIVTVSWVAANGQQIVSASTFICETDTCS